MSRFALLVTIVGLAGSLQAHDFISTKLTWSREVSRIVYKRCVSCHHEGGSAFSLVTYAEARPWAQAIKDEVLSRRMPPWNAVKGFGEFKDEQGLTQEQIEIIADWVEGTAPEGDKTYMPKVPDFGDGPQAMPKPVPGGLVVTGSLVLKSAAEFAGVQGGIIPPSGAVQVTAVLPDGAVEPVIWLENFNANDHGAYFFKSPLKVPAGTRIEVVPARGASISLLSASAESSAASRSSGPGH